MFTSENTSKFGMCAVIILTTGKLPCSLPPRLQTNSAETLSFIPLRFFVRHFSSGNFMTVKPITEVTLVVGSVLGAKFTA